MNAITGMWLQGEREVLFLCHYPAVLLLIYVPFILLGNRSHMNMEILQTLVKIDMYRNVRSRVNSIVLNVV